MRTASILLGILGLLGLFAGFLPLLGWVNWFATLPPALLGLLLGVLARDRGATTFNAVVIGLAALRLLLGGGFF
ncbi:hypothetical protein GCM10017783_14650 [Deinococcus piscis]|uniref:Uncharacterized protein n=1 Tax=Deinococcus piscis TaxID=394230 RepID=A0ABQ3K4C4_9DEIO|nr:hypothetical protein [Deinococcus piscis]GHG03300.1 hypothetical protein GCM10017783_14650 [Deinococcus piscis]